MKFLISVGDDDFEREICLLGSNLGCLMMYLEVIPS
jgi:hypothetical protein